VRSQRALKALTTRRLAIRLSRHPAQLLLIDRGGIRFLQGFDVAGEFLALGCSLIPSHDRSFRIPAHPDDLRWAAAEGVSETVIAAVLLLHERSVEQIVAEAHRRRAGPGNRARRAISKASTAPVHLILSPPPTAGPDGFPCVPVCPWPDACR
jgi:hypothetical protein